MQITAIIKEEFADVRPDAQYPRWTSHVGESEENLKSRMRNKGCDPARYEWSTGGTTSGGNGA